MDQLAFVVGGLDPRRLLSWFQDKAQGSAATRELDLLSDYYLDDIGIGRRIDLRAGDLVNRLRAGG